MVHSSARRALSRLLNVFATPVAVQAASGPVRRGCLLFCGSGRGQANHRPHSHA
jgi:hypothetical protein